MLWIPLLMSMALGVFGLPPGYDLCPRMKLEENFNLQKFLGKWYEAERYFAPMYMTVKCSTMNYTMTDNGTVRLIESAYSTQPGADSTVIRQETLINMTNEPKFEVKIEDGFYLMDSLATFYGILGTDYDNYSVLWSCLDIGLIRSYSTRIFTRQKHPESAVLESAYKHLEKNKIDRGLLKPTDKEYCPEDY